MQRTLVGGAITIFLEGAPGTRSTSMKILTMGIDESAFDQASLGVFHHPRTTLSCAPRSDATAGGKISIARVKAKLDRYNLRDLIRSLGLSLPEAASYIGISRGRLSRTLAARPEQFEVQEVLAKLAALAVAVDGMVESETERVRRLRKTHRPNNTPVPEVKLLIYRRNEDLPPWFEFAFASVHRAAVARIARTRGCRASLVAFERDAYLKWLGLGCDNAEAHADSAADVAFGDLAANVVFGAVGVEWNVGAFEHPQQFALVGAQAPAGGREWRGQSCG
jgi:transcriptional regulator with XRE-family HTH domain